jgi:hypothetical protein
LVQKWITALLAAPALVAFGLVAATSTSAIAAPASSVNAAHHTVRSAAASAHPTPAPALSLSLSTALLPTGQGSATRHAVGSPDFTTSGLCLSYNHNPYYCLFYTKVDTQATLGDDEGVELEENYIRTVSSDNTFTFGSGYNGLYKGDRVYCFEDSKGDFVSTTLEANYNVIVNEYAGSCTGVYDEWVAVGKWLVNVGETDWAYAEGYGLYPYSEVMESGCDTTGCGVWVDESAPSSNNDDQWSYVTFNSGAKR